MPTISPNRMTDITVKKTPSLLASALAERSPHRLSFGQSTEEQFQRTPAPKILFVVNLKSGRALRHPLMDELRGTLQKLNVQQAFEIVPIQDFPNALSQYRQSLDRVIALGGDGTASYVISSVAAINTDETQIKVGVVPMGTGNLLAKNIHIPRNFEQALSVSLGDRTTPLDTATFNGRTFVVNAGAGVDAAATKRAHGSESKKKLGIFSYVVKGMQELMHPQIREFEVDADGQKFRCKGLGVMVANTRDMLGPLTLTPTARHDDRMLSVSILGVTNLRTFIKGITQAVFQTTGGTDQKSGLINVQAKKVTVTWKDPLESQVDGEITGPITRIDAEIAQQVPILVKD